MEKTSRLISFENLKTDFEKAYIQDTSSIACGNALQALSRAIANAILKKVMDPQGKKAENNDKKKWIYNNGIWSLLPVPSDNACNPNLAQMKRGLQADTQSLDILPELANKEYTYKYNKNGEVVQLVNRDIRKRLNKEISYSISDGMDLAQEASLAIWEESVKYCNGKIGFLDFTYTEKVLSKKVKIRYSDSAKWEDKEFSPITKAFKTVRSYVNSNKSVKFDPRSGYLYIEDLAVNPDNGDCDIVYWRLPKFADFGTCESKDCANPEEIVIGKVNNACGQYTANNDIALHYSMLLESLELSERQADILTLRNKGYGLKAIASYYGISKQAVQNTLAKVEKKARALLGNEMVDSYKASVEEKRQKELAMQKAKKAVKA